MEHTDDVGPTHRVVHRGFFARDCAQIEYLAESFFDFDEDLVDCPQHPEPQKVELDQSHVGAVVFVPLQNRSARHSRVFDGDDLADGLFRQHHPAGMDSEVTGERQGFVGEPNDVFGYFGCFRRVEPAPPFDKPRPRVLVVDPVPERAGDVADGVLGSIGDDVGDLGGVSSTVFLEHVLDDFFAAVGVEIDVDVGRFVA